MPCLTNKYLTALADKQILNLDLFFGRERGGGARQMEAFASPVIHQPRPLLKNHGAI